MFFLLLLTKHIYISYFLLEYIDVTQVIDNMVDDCLLYHLLENEKEVLTSRKLSKHAFINIRYLRKEATYGKKYTRKEEFELFRNSIRERLYFIYNVAKMQQTKEAFFRIWGK